MSNDFNNNPNRPPQFTGGTGSDGVSVTSDAQGNINVYVNTGENKDDESNKDKGQDKKKLVVYSVFGVIALICVTLMVDAFTPNKKETYDPASDIYGSLTAEEKLIMEQNFGVTTKDTIFKNPELSLFDKIFCMGFKKSSYCKEDPIHPLVNFVEEEYGISYEEWRKKTGEHKTEKRIPGKRKISKE